MNNLFAHRLRQSMKDKNLKQIDIMRAAEEKGVKLGKSHVSQYVSGKTIPRDNILKVLAEILDVDAYTGVLIVSEGAKSPVIKRQLQKTVSSILQLPAHRIVILPMEEGEGGSS